MEFATRTSRIQEISGKNNAWGIFQGFLLDDYTLFYQQHFYKQHYNLKMVYSWELNSKTFAKWLLSQKFEKLDFSKTNKLGGGSNNFQIGQNILYHGFLLTKFDFKISDSRKINRE